MNPRNSPAVDEALKLRNLVAREFENMNYEQLKQFVATLDRTANGWTTLHRKKLPNGVLDVDALICEWGLVRRRISVELAVYSDDGAIHPGVVPSIYFERFASGAIFKPGARGTVVMIGAGLVLLALVLILWFYVKGSN